MVALTTMQASNALINTLPIRLVAVFVGATSGIGEATFKVFAQRAGPAHLYLVGRNQASADRIFSECKTLNSQAEYTFIESDVSLIKNVDTACNEIKEKEKVVNVLFQSQGVLKLTRPSKALSPSLISIAKQPYSETSEGLEEVFALTYYSRMRFIQNLLPLLQAAPYLRRVLTVFAGTKEGPLFPDNNFQAENISILKIANIRGHMCSLMDLCLEAFAKLAPGVSFIHDYPGFVKTDLLNKQTGLIHTLVRTFSKVTAPSHDYIPLPECGERHVFLATSARYKPREDGEAAGVPMAEGSSVARGIDGVAGSGVYVVDENGESAGAEVERLLSGMRSEGMVETIWEHTARDFGRITKSAS